MEDPVFKLQIKANLWRINANPEYSGANKCEVVACNTLYDFTAQALPALTRIEASCVLSRPGKDALYCLRALPGEFKDAAV